MNNQIEKHRQYYRGVAKASREAHLGVPVTPPTALDLTSGVKAIDGRVMDKLVTGMKNPGGIAALGQFVQTYGAFRTSINAQSFYRHQLRRRDKQLAALNTLAAIDIDGGIADIMFPKGASND